MKETNYKVEELTSYIDLKDSDTHAKFMSYIGNTEKGSTVDIRTPFYKEGKNYPLRENVLKKWIPQLQVLKDKLPGLYEYEMKMAEKVGPMSLQAPLSERWDAIHEYWKAIHSPQQPISDEAVKAVVSEVTRIKGIRIRNVIKTLENMDLSKGAGAPFLGKKRDAVVKTIPYHVFSDKNDTILLELHDGTWKAVAILGWRGQEGGPEPEDVKQRVIWMFPFALSIEELSFYQPLIQACQGINFNPAWVSNDAVDMRMTQLMKTKGRKDKIICTDFTKFDQHFNPTMVEAVREIYWQITSNDTPTVNWMLEIFPMKFNIPLLAGTTLLTGEHGMASGSGGTNCDETFGHRALQYEAAIGAGQRLNPNSMCSGDDGCLTFPGVSKEVVTDSYTKHGLEMNMGKQDESVREATYLRRWYDIEYTINGLNRGVYATTRAIGRLCAQEREYDPDVWGPKMVTLRYLSIIENCKYHPLFEEFIEFCIKGDKYRLGVDIPGFYDDLGAIVKESIAMIPNFMSYTQKFELSNMRLRNQISGIESWAVVKYIREHYSTYFKHKTTIIK